VTSSREVSLRDGKCCFATRRVTPSREALFKTFEKCDFVTISVALRREGLLRNEKSDFVTRSVVTSLDPSVGYADSSRRFHLHFSNALCLPAASYHRTSQMFIAFPADFSPSLPAGCAGTSRRTWSVTSRGFSNRTSRRLFRQGTS
jgi:hypothetical protein